MAKLMPSPLRRRLVRYVPRRLLYSLSWLFMLGTSDRIVLERRIIPTLLDGEANKVLSVGVAYYNAHHAALFAARGVELWTIDIDPQAARWGSPGRHVTGNALDVDAHFPPGTFDAVILNGVLGYGINGEIAVSRALTAIAAVLKPNGRLVIGWNDDKAADPTTVPEAEILFRPCPGIDGTSHLALQDDTMVYDFLEKRPKKS